MLLIQWIIELIFSIDWLHKERKREFLQIINGWYIASLDKIGKESTNEKKYFAKNVYSKTFSWEIKEKGKWRPITKLNLTYLIWAGFFLVKGKSSWN